jgi:hypothetical protein
MNRDDLLKWESMTDDQQREAWESARNDLAEERAMYRGLAEAHNAAVTTANVRLAEIAALKAQLDQARDVPRIYTRCPSCHNDTLTINKGHLLCTWIECRNPTLIHTMGADAGKPDHIVDGNKMVAPPAGGPLEYRYCPCGIHAGHRPGAVQCVVCDARDAAGKVAPPAWVCGNCDCDLSQYHFPGGYVCHECGEPVTPPPGVGPRQEVKP